MFFQVSWIRCHIVRIQGKKERRNPVKTGGKLLTLTIFDLELCSLHQKVAFWKACMKNKVFGNQITEEKLEIFASVPYRSFTGRGKKRIWEFYNRHFEQILPTFCHGTKVKPWKFEEKIYKFIVRLTGGRRKERKKKA